jgi:hypothetical protein
MIEGKIADEDFNGDPECNALGKVGIRGRVTKKAGAEDDSVVPVSVSPPPPQTNRSACNQVF